MPCCCVGGGCCRQAPEKLTHDTQDGSHWEDLTDQPDYYPIGCCSNEGSGVEDEPPDELFCNGNQRHIFYAWIEKLESIKTIRPANRSGLQAYNQMHPAFSKNCIFLSFLFYGVKADCRSVGPGPLKLALFYGVKADCRSVGPGPLKLAGRFQPRGS